MPKKMLGLLARILLSPPLKAVVGLTPSRVFGKAYASLLAEVTARLAASGQDTPAGFEDDHRVVTHWYTKDKFDPDLDYRALNTLLRTGNHSNASSLLILAINLTDALSKLPNEVGMSFRVIRDYPTFAAEYVSGSVVMEQSFLSSSRNPRNSFPGQIYFTLFGRSGSFIGGMSDFLAEDEILFPSQTKFEVLKVVHLADGTIHVIMQEQ